LLPMTRGEELPMTTAETHSLRRFFGLGGGGEDCRLYLPTFRGPVSLESKPTPPAQAPAATQEPAFRYPGHTFADRDAKAASYVASVLSRAIDLDEIRWEEAGTFTPRRSGTVFLFGSRSNQATGWATRGSALGKFVQFEFGDE